MKGISMAQSSFFNSLDAEKLSEEELKIAKAQLHTLRYQLLFSHFLSEGEQVESSDIPENVLIRDLPQSSKYTCFRPILIYDEAFPKEADEFEGIFLEAFKFLESSDRAKRLLDYFQDRYEQSGEQITLRGFAGNLAFFENDCMEADGTTVNRVIGEVITAKENEDFTVANIHTRRKDSICVAEIIFHELVHQQHNNIVFTEVLKNNPETIDVQELMMMLYCDELFAYTAQRVFLFEKFRASSDMLTNYLALLQKDVANLSHKELGIKSALAYINVMINGIEPKDVPHKIQHMHENYFYSDFALKKLKEKKDRHEDLFLEPVEMAVPYLMKRDVPVENITFEGKGVRNIFNRFVGLHFPELLEDTQQVDIEQKSFALMKDLPMYAKPYINFSEKEFMHTSKIIYILQRLRKSLDEQKKVPDAPVVVSHQREACKSQKQRDNQGEK